MEGHGCPDRWLRYINSICESAVFADDWLVKLWLWCLSRASKNGETVLGIKVPPGSFVTKMDAAAGALLKNKSTVWRGLQSLVNHGLLDVSVVASGKSKSTLVTVTAWKELYLGDAEDEEFEQDSDDGEPPATEMPNPPMPFGPICSVEIPKESGVYFGWENDVCTYVGKSTNLNSRLRSHSVLKKTTNVSWILLPPNKIHHAELYYIWTLKPPENGESKSAMASEHPALAIES